MRISFVLGIALIASLIGIGFAGSASLFKSCKVNSDCRRGLACDVRHEPVTNSCLIVYGGMCSKSMDCVNGLKCANGRCTCPENTYYDDERNDCIPNQIFGEQCKNDNQCAGLLVCSSRGDLVDVCLQDLGSMCSQDKDCANELKCIHGKCGCVDKYETYNPQNRDCDLIRLTNEKCKCANNSECKHDALACDQTINGNKTSTCARIFGEICQSFSDCANGLECIEYICQCQENQYYDYEVHDCLFKKQFKEECDENYKCADNLVCDVNVEPTPISEERKFVCLKSHDVQCKNDTECVNFLSCNDGRCGCPPNYYYNKELLDCFPKQDFGEPCSTNEECLPSLACDLSPTGTQTKTCANLFSARCSDFSDCVNSLDCINGQCKCAWDKHFNTETNECEVYKDLKKKSLDGINEPDAPTQPTK